MDDLNKQLSDLDLNFQHDKELPWDIIKTYFDGKHLEQLILNNNILTTIPATIGNLKKLTILTLNDNQLTYLPNLLCDLNLKTIWIHNNPKLVIGSQIEMWLNHHKTIGSNVRV